LYTLPSRHLEVLQWFEDNAGRVFPERPRLIDGLSTAVTDPMSGIWKPSGQDYALSITQTYSHKYPDLPPYYVQGSWVYQYHQEGPQEEPITKRHTNRGLEECRLNDIPVGVILPAPETGNGAYKVLGLGFVDDYRDGYFIVSGPVIRTSTGFSMAGATFESLDLTTLVTEDSAEYAAAGEKQRALASIVRRQGQPHFRRQLLRAYGTQCAMSRYDASEALEAAHISPYSGPRSNRTDNGLLLRADLHNLFDLGLVAIDTSAQSVLVHSELARTKYEDLDGRRLHLPADRDLSPSVDRLDEHRAAAGL